MNSVHYFSCEQNSLLKGENNVFHGILLIEITNKVQFHYIKLYGTDTYAQQMFSNNYNITFLVNYIG